MNPQKLLSNKKFLLILGGLIFIALIIFLITLRPSTPSTENNLSEYTDDTEYIDYSNHIEEYITTNHPVDSILPIRNESPFYYINLRVDSTDSGTLTAVIEISYYTVEGKTAAETLLKSSKFAPYHPENYQHIYVELTN